MNINDYVIDEKIPWTDRIANAFTYSIQYLTSGITNILISPIIFFRTLFTPTRKALDILRAIDEHPELLAQRPISPETNFPLDGESWKQEHDKLFGEDDE